MCCNFYSDKDKDKDIELWTIDYLVDILEHHLLTFEMQPNQEEEGVNNIHDNNINSVNFKKYIIQALQLRNASQIYFTIDVVDLNKKTIEELYSLSVKNRVYVLKQAVERFLMKADPGFYSRYIPRLKVRLRYC